MTVKLVALGATLSVLLSIGGSRAAVTHTVQLQNNRFSPAEIRARVGDTLHFKNTPGGLHNVQFHADSIAPRARALLDSAMPGKKIAPLASPLLILEDETYTMRVPALPEGRYPLFCSPHFGNMRGALVVER
jgi:plastocyanin